MSVVVVVINCPEETLTYHHRPELLFLKGEIKSSYPSYFVARLIYAVTNNHPLLCYEMSNMSIFRNFVGSIKELSLDSLGLKWIQDLLNLEKWIEQFKMTITSSFTKANMNRSVTTIRLTFPYSAHLGGGFGFASPPISPLSVPTHLAPLGPPIARQSGKGDGDVEEEKEGEEEKDEEEKEKSEGGVRGTVGSLEALPQHCYQFVYKCFYDALPGAKSGAIDNKYFEFTFSKEKYKRRDQVEKVVNEFIGKYRKSIHKDGLTDIIWNINKVNSFFCIVKSDDSDQPHGIKRKLEDVE